MTVTITSMRAEDAAALAQIAAQSFPHPRDEAAFLAECHEPVARVLVAREGHTILGYHVVWVSLDEAEIIEIAVAPGARGRQLADALLLEMVTRLKGEGIKALFLEVRVSNAPARRLYRRFGFEEVGRRKGYYADNGEDALLYRLELDGAEGMRRGQAPLVRGLYPILSDSHLALGQFAEAAQLIADQSGVSIMQLRLKHASDADYWQVAKEVAGGLRGWKGALIINDRADIAHLLQQEGFAGIGLHVGQDDFPVVQARTLLGQDAIIGLSTHDTAQVKAAHQEAVDYLGYGPIFATQTKLDAQAKVGLEGLAKAVSTALPLPVVAIGGLDVARAAFCLQQGASSVAVIGALFDGLKGPWGPSERQLLRSRLNEFEAMLRQSSCSGVRA